MSMIRNGLFGILLAVPSISLAQQSIFGNNLIVNGGADLGAASTSLTSTVSTIPGWTVTGSANVLPYDLPGALLSTQPSPPDRSFQYFESPSTATLTQDIDVSSAASAINAGTVIFTASAYLGSVAPTGFSGSAQMTVSFENSAGQSFQTISLGPMTNRAAPSSLSLQRQIGLVPAGTVRITVTLTLLNSATVQGYGAAYGAADSLSLQLDTVVPASTVLGPNLVQNPGAEVGAGVPSPALAVNIPSWSTGTAPNSTSGTGPSVAPYGGTGWIGLADPGPPNRGVNVFGGAAGRMYQDINVAAAGSLIDSGTVTYQISAWLGGVNGTTSPTFTYQFFDWTGKQLAATAQFGPASYNVTSLVQSSHSDVLPSGTRRVHIDVTFPSANSLADNFSFTLSTPSPVILLTPSNGAGGISITPTLSWMPVSGATSYNLYFGTNPTPPFFVTTSNTSQGAPTLNANTVYYWMVTSSNTASSSVFSFTTGQTAHSRAKVGIFRSDYLWLEDVDGNNQFNDPPDTVFAFGGVPGDIPITGDWNGDGRSKAGIYRSSSGVFLLDYNGDGMFDPSIDKVYNLGVGTQAGDVPVAGDWNGDGRTKVGLFRQGYFWILDYNGDGVFTSNDKAFAFGGAPGDVPVVGDWTGNGISKVGLFRAGFFWLLDTNGDGLFEPGVDAAFPFGGAPGDVPVVGDWNGDGTTKVGVFRAGYFWVLDANGNHTFDGVGPGEDLAFPFGGAPGDVPVVGKW